MPTQPAALFGWRFGSSVTAWEVSMRGYELMPDSALGLSSGLAGTSDRRYVLALSANESKSLVVPGDARAVLFSATDDIWVLFNGMPVVPTTDIVNGAAPELNPIGRSIDGTITSIGVVSPRACQVGLYFFGR